jgi:hypothetical protein
MFVILSLLGLLLPYRKFFPSKAKGMDATPA